MGRGREAGDHIAREQRTQLGAGCGATEPARRVVDVVQLAPIDRGQEVGRGGCNRVVPLGGRLGDRRPEALEPRCDRLDLPASLLAHRWMHGREERGTGHELEGRVEDERVGGIGTGDREDLADLGDQARVRCGAGGDEGIRDRHADHRKTSSSLEVNPPPPAPVSASVRTRIWSLLTPKRRGGVDRWNGTWPESPRGSLGG